MHPAILARVASGGVNLMGFETQYARSREEAFARVVGAA